MRSAIIIRNKPEDALIRLLFIDTELQEPVSEIHVADFALRDLLNKKMITQIPAPLADKTYYRYTKHPEGADVYLFSRVRQRDTEIDGFNDALELMKKMHVALHAALQLFPKNHPAMREVHKINNEVGEAIKKAL